MDVKKKTCDKVGTEASLNFITLLLDRLNLTNELEKEEINLKPQVLIVLL